MAAVGLSAEQAERAGYRVRSVDVDLGLVFPFADLAERAGQVAVDAEDIVRVVIGSTLYGDQNF